MLTDSAAVAVTRPLFTDWRRECDLLDRIDRWCRWKLDDIKLPRKATAELRALAELSKTPWLGLVVTTVAQCMYVDGYRSPLDTTASAEEARGGPWRIWQANGFDRRQIAVHRAALQYGYSFVTVLPGDPTSVLRGVSPRKMFAAYDSPAEDDWPRYAIHVDTMAADLFSIRLYDAEA
ncbi:MAG: phage portal protein, partial [Pseudonocardiaceae bacterium]